MPKKKTPQERYAGQLVSAIQGVWVSESRELHGTHEQAAYAAMNRAHQLLQAAANHRLDDELAGRTVAEYVGSDLVEGFRAIADAVGALQAVAGEA